MSAGQMFRRPALGEGWDTLLRLHDHSRSVGIRYLLPQSKVTRLLGAPELKWMSHHGAEFGNGIKVGMIQLGPKAQGSNYRTLPIPSDYITSVAPTIPQRYTTCPLKAFCGLSIPS